MIFGECFVDYELIKKEIESNLRLNRISEIADQLPPEKIFDELCKYAVAFISSNCGENFNCTIEITG